MAKSATVKIWYDREADFLEVVFDKTPGYFQETASDRVMKKVDRKGRLLGFHILRASGIKRPLNVRLA